MDRTSIKKFFQGKIYYMTLFLKLVTRGAEISIENQNNKLNDNLPSIEELNIKDQETINKWTEKIIYYTKTCYYKSDFSKLIRFLNCKIPQFLQKNENILYLIMKYILFDKIRIGEIEGCIKFYKEYFLHLLKKTHFANWERKNNNFQVIITNPGLLRNYDYLIKSEQNFHNFILLLERELFKFINTNNNELENDIGDNKEYFSDLEDELVYSSENLNQSRKIIPNSSNIQNTQIDPLKDRSSNFYNCRKEYIPKMKKEIEKMKETIPLLKNFNPNYTKRANIDKMILRKFKNYLIQKYHKNVLNNFWVKFIEGNYLPPFKVYDDELKKEVEFKSFNTNYLFYIFNKENAITLFDEFLNDSGKEMLEILIHDYNLENQALDIEKLQFYIYHLHEVFSNYTHNNSSNKDSKQNDETKFKDSSSDLKDEVNINNLSLTNDSSNMEAPLNPLSYEKVYENYLGQNFDMENNKKDLFHMINFSFKPFSSRVRNCRKNQKKYDSDSDRSLERSRELDYHLFDNFKKNWTDSSSDKEE